MTIAGHATQILRPERFNGRVVIYCHGSGETEIAPNVSLGKPDTVRVLTQAGYVVASSTGSGPTNWGSPDAVDAYEALHDYLVDWLVPDRVLWWCDSMGGMSSLNTILRTDVRCDGWYGIEPAVNLANVYANGFGPYIDAAYGCTAGTYAAVTAGYDPVLRAAADFDGIPMRFVASPSDVSVSKTANTDTLATLVTGHAVIPLGFDELVVAATGLHGDLSHYLPFDVVSFFDAASGV